ncbi:MAG: hypothetical protein JWR59_672 [Brevundimonas sp.]|nr:hypothetical protein [Brevundimonas sp.]
MALDAATTKTKASVRAFDGAGVRLSADVMGEEAAIPVLFLHGGGQTRHAWKGSIEAVAKAGFYGVAADLRGHGDSDWSPVGDYSLTAFADDTRALAGQLAGSPVLVGASLGGLSSLLAAGEDPRLATRGIVLVDIAPEIEPEGAKEISDFMRSAPDGFASLEDAADAVAAYLPTRPRPKKLDGLKRNLRQGADGRWRWHWDPRLMSESGPAATRHKARLQAAATRITAPVLLVRGGHSRVITAEGARALKTQIPHAEFVDVADADHMVAGDANDAFTAAVLDFLSRHAPSRSASSRQA